MNRQPPGPPARGSYGSSPGARLPATGSHPRAGAPEGRQPQGRPYPDPPPTGQMSGVAAGARGYGAGPQGAQPYGDVHTAAHPVPYGDVPYGDAFDPGYGEAYEDGFAGTVFGDDVYGDRTYGDDPYGDVDEGIVDDDGSGRRGLARLGVVVAVVVGIILLAAALVGLWVNSKVNPGGSPGETVTVELESGQSTAEIAQVLTDHGVVGDARIFTLYARFRSKGDIQAGSYELQTDMAMGDVLTILAGGPGAADEAMVTIPEGLRLDEVVNRLSDPEGPGFDAEEVRSLIQGDALRSPHLPDGARSIEGTLFPDTYSLADDATAEELLRAMVDQFDQVYEELGVAEASADLPVGSGYEVLIVASMIEAEAASEDDRPMIARVIYNRMAQDHPLQIDATSCYDKPPGECHPLSSEDLQSEYSTRSQAGLTPTPIGSPGRASLEAALNPADGDWFYYVLDVDDEDRGHVFAVDDTDQEFQDALQRCRDAEVCG